MATTNRNPYLPIPKTATQIASEQTASRLALLAQRRAYLASGDCTDPAIRADIERQIEELVGPYPNGGFSAACAAEYAHITEARRSMTMTILRLTCSCCGGTAPAFTRHHNRDTGYGLCGGCAARIMTRRDYVAAEFARCYGEEGVHWLSAERLADLVIDAVTALERLADRVEAIELPDGSTPDTATQIERTPADTARFHADMQRCCKSQRGYSDREARAARMGR